MEMPQLLEKQYTGRGLISAPSSACVLQELTTISKPLFTLRKKNTLITQGGIFKGLYIVHCGMLKQTLKREAEDEVLSHFFLPGDVIGLDAMGEESYSGTVTAIETSGLIHIPFRRIEDLSSICTSHRQLLRCMSREMHHERSRIWQLINHPADVRLALFFVAMSLNFRARGYSPYSFRLGMSKREIAQYLCMTSETLSRLISRFKLEGVISVSSHVFCILNAENLDTIAKQRMRR